MSSLASIRGKSPISQPPAGRLAIPASATLKYQKPTLAIGGESDKAGFYIESTYQKQRIFIDEGLVKAAGLQVGDTISATGGRIKMVVQPGTERPDRVHHELSGNVKLRLRIPQATLEFKEQLSGVGGEVARGGFFITYKNRRIFLSDEAITKARLKQGDRISVVSDGVETVRRGPLPTTGKVFTHYEFMGKVSLAKVRS